MYVLRIIDKHICMTYIYNIYIYYMYVCIYIYSWVLWEVAGHGHLPM